MTNDSGPPRVETGRFEGTNEARLDLYWIPLGAGTPVVRASGRAYEAVMAFAQRRPRRALFHAALVAPTDVGTFTIEVAPIPDRHGPTVRGVVGEGAVGTRLAGWLRIFRYEIRCWRDGKIPDLAFAVASPVPLSDSVDEVLRVFETLALAPRPVWGRDELRAGEMWNSNSVVAWVLARAGLLARAGPAPAGGRAPGWDAGVVVARRDGELAPAAPTGGRRARA